MNSRKFELSSNDRQEIIILPVNPQSFAISYQQQNKVISLVDVGEVNTLGNRGLATISSIDSFFPCEDSPFYRYAQMPPERYVETIKCWQEKKEPLRLIITDMNITIAVAIESFGTTIVEGSKDVAYALQLKEFRFLNIMPTSGSLKEQSLTGLEYRPNSLVVPKEYFIKSQNDTLWALAVRFYGDGDKWKKLAENNPHIEKDNPQIGQRVVLI
ncbi:MAG: LysM domain-containing protein [Oscillospiraceae bacterium]